MLACVSRYILSDVVRRFPCLTASILAIALLFIHKFSFTLLPLPSSFSCVLRCSLPTFCLTIRELC